LAPRFWQVGALCRAIADSLDARFNPVAVRGEISGFSRASSGHCYFTLKDAQGQIRCAMFRRAAGLLDFTPRDGEMVEVRGRLGVYEPRGDLQLIVEALGKVGQGALFEQFLQRKARLEAQGLFSPERKRPLPTMPRAIGVVTSLGAAALHDVATALRRRVPHIPVVLAPALVQGGGAADDLVRALNGLYQRSDVDVILLVRGGGSLEDLWAFNDENLAHTISRSPVPVVSGVGHETDFTIADFVADLRAPTPTAAAELVAQPRDAWLGALDRAAERLQNAVQSQLDRHAQRLDVAVARLGRPSGRIAGQQLQLSRSAQRLHYAVQRQLQQSGQRLSGLGEGLTDGTHLAVSMAHERLERAGLRLQLLDPRLVLQRGYALLQDSAGQLVTRVDQAHAGQCLEAHVSDGRIHITVSNEG
jgi:exodeoxyribonuclease VII large subunit